MLQGNIHPLQHGSLQRTPRKRVVEGDFYMGRAGKVCK